MHVERWFVVFTPKTERRWLTWLCWGLFRHVRALGYVPGADVWVVYDVTFDRTDILVVPDEDADSLILAAAEAEGVVVAMPPLPRGGRLPRFGFFCVPAIAHLLGLNSGALRPDRLFVDCLAAGGEVLEIGRGRTEDRDAAGLAPAGAGGAA